MNYLLHEKEPPHKPNVNLITLHLSSSPHILIRYNYGIISIHPEQALH